MIWWKDEKFDVGVVIAWVVTTLNELSIFEKDWKVQNSA